METNCYVVPVGVQRIHSHLFYIILYTHVLYERKDVIEYIFDGICHIIVKEITKSMHIATIT